MDEYTKTKLLANLKNCTSSSAIDVAFIAYMVSNKQERLNLLNECMGVTESFSNPVVIPLDEEYEDTIAIFLEGTWRLLQP